MSGAITPFPNTPSRRGAQLKHRDNFTSPFTNNNSSIVEAQTLQVEATTMALSE
jgi:hypothetical protein